jgi:hypothetical protein
MEKEHIEVVTPKFVILRSSGNPTPNLLNHYKYHSQDDMHETLEMNATKKKCRESTRKL